MKRMVLIVNDRPFCTEALKDVIRGTDDTIEVAMADSIGAIKQALAQRPFKALLLDLNLAEGDGLENLSHVRSHYPTLSVLVVSDHDTPALVAQVHALGAKGFLSKRAPLAEIHNAISVVLQGGQWFPDEKLATGAAEKPIGQISPAQARVMVELAKGQPNKIIAHKLDLSEATVKSHLSAIYRALKVSNRAQAILTVRNLHA